jgi:galactose oxidase
MFIKPATWAPGALFFGSFLPFVSSQSTFPWASLISRDGWRVKADSEQPGHEARNAIDSDPNTLWHTKWGPDDPLPHWIQVDMGRQQVVSGISYIPRPDGPANGAIGDHEIYLSDDGVNWAEAVAYGTYLQDKTTKTTFFASKAARHVKLVALSEAQGNGDQWTSMADFSIYTPNPYTDPRNFRPPNPAVEGQWDVTVDFPIVPVAGAHAKDDTFVFWSAFKPDRYEHGTGSTETVKWNPSTGAITRRNVANTRHDMFCPGISMDANGLIIVTGGNDNKKTSIYSPDANEWISAADMVIGRGYQSQTLLSDGRTWLIGGSWSGPQGGKNGEVWHNWAWALLPGCDVNRILTDDVDGVFRSDSHPWIFAWTDRSIFQAGPSKAMHWFGVDGQGSTQDAGHRGDDNHAMCGMAAMFDAVEGKIFTAGGSPNYMRSTATNHANLVQIGSPGSRPRVTKLPNMSYARAFGNAVVLPDGKVLVVGGQEYALPFNDQTAALRCELFDPATNSFTLVAPIAVARVYHSIGILLSDGRVLSGGGGLCGTGCKENHFDLQIWSPPYLFNKDGSRAKRPTILSASPITIYPGDTLTVQADTPATFSLVRFGSATHGIDTDQRRVPLKASSGGGNTYTLPTPTDPGKLLPGYWMLFALNSAGVPSVAKTIKVLVA